MSRPDWVKCVGYGYANGRRADEAWCGNKLETWHFVDATHASLNGHQKGRLVACRECVGAICAALRNGHDEPEYKQEDE